MTSATDSEYLGKTLLETVRLLVSADPRIVKIFFYVWPGWNTDLDRYTIQDGKDTQTIILPKNQNEYVVSITREKLLHYEPVKKLIEIIEQHDLISLCARVEMSNGQERYIPSIDVRMPKSKKNLAFLEKFIQCIYDRLNYEGDMFIFESTKSYYLMGSEVVHLHDMLQFLAFCTLTHVQSSSNEVTSLNDIEYLGYMLFKRFDNGLRLMNNMEQNSTITPKVVKVLRRDIARTAQPLPVAELDDDLLAKLGRS